MTDLTSALKSEKIRGLRLRSPLCVPRGATLETVFRKMRDEGKGYAVVVDLSKYFDTLNHELLMNVLRRQIRDKRVIGLIKKYLKSGVMENGLICKTEEGSPQGGPLSPASPWRKPRTD